MWNTDIWLPQRTDPHLVQQLQTASEDDASQRSMKLYEEMKKGRKPTRSDTCVYVKELRCTVTDTFY